MARNRKRAKERRARRPQPVATPRANREEAPDPIAHAAPDVELAEAQLARGRPDAPESSAADQEEFVLEAGSDEAEDGFGGDSGEPPEGDGGSLVLSGGGESRRAGTAVAEPRLGVVGRLLGFLQGSWRELQRVQWPDRRQVAQATGVVLGFVIVAGVFLGLADLVASKLVTFIINGK